MGASVGVGKASCTAGVVDGLVSSVWELGCGLMVSVSLVVVVVVVGGGMSGLERMSGMFVPLCSH